MTLKQISDARARIRIRPGGSRALVYRRGRKQDHTLGWVHLDADLARLPAGMVPPNVALPDYIRPELDAADLVAIKAAILAHREANAWPTLHPNHIASLRASWAAAEASAALDVPAPTTSDLRSLAATMYQLSQGGMTLSPEMRARAHPANVKNELDAAFMELQEHVARGQAALNLYLRQTSPA
jgi:hypothetical protein